MARLRYNGLSATLGAALTSSGTSITFTAALASVTGAVPTITGSDYIPLTMLDTTGAVKEIVYLTAYTSGATTGTITRGQEATTGVAHASGDAAIHAPTVADVAFGFVRARYNSGTTTLTTSTMAQVTNSVSGVVKAVIPASVGDLLEIGIDLQAADNVATWIDLNAATFVAGAEVNRVGGTGTTGSIPSWGMRESNFWPQSARTYYTVVAGDISGGTVEVRLLGLRGGSTNRAIFSTAAAPLDFTIKNLGKPS